MWLTMWIIKSKWVCLSNSLLLFLAGQDTTSSALSVTSHFLAKNQDLQEMLYQEIKDAIDENDGDPNLGKIVYCP